MSDDMEKAERQDRAKRLRDARKRATSDGPTAICARNNWNLNNYKAHESGRNGFGILDAKRYARAFNVSIQWLNFGIGSIEDAFMDASEDIQQIMDILESLPPEIRQAQIDYLRSVSSALLAQERQKDSLPAKDAAV